jgi:hypothetical protein
MNPQRRLVLAGLLAAGPMLASAHPQGGDSASFVTRKLSIGGRVQQNLELSPEALTSFPVQAPAEIPIIGRTGEVLRILRGYSGARLSDVLDKAGLLVADLNELKRTVIVASASDGYKAIFSWNEIYNTVVGAGVLVLHAREGKPLGDEEGRIALISTRDLNTGPRHVRWLKDVQIQQIA